MKTKTYLSIIALTILSVTTFSSCDNDEGDTTKPVISLEEPADGENLLIGDEVHFEMDLSDDVMLKSYKVDIHNNFDNHGHKRAAATTDFTFQKSWDISGQKNIHIHHHEIVIPEDATPGNYHMVVYCTDEAGNEAHIARNIVLKVKD